MVSSNLVYSALDNLILKTENNTKKYKMTIISIEKTLPDHIPNCFSQNQEQPHSVQSYTYTEIHLNKEGKLNKRRKNNFMV